MSTAMPMQPQAQFSAEPPKSKGCGLVSFLGCGCAVMLLLCCGGGGLFSFMTFNSFKNAYTTDPAAVVEISNSIATLDIPAHFNPEGAMAPDIPLVGKAFKLAAYGSDQPHEMLMLMELGEYVSQDDILNGFAQNSRSNNQDEDREALQVDSSQTEELVVRGERAVFTFQESHDPQTQAKYWQVQGGFSGRGGPALLIFTLSQENHTRDDLKRIVESIR